MNNKFGPAATLRDIPEEIPHEDHIIELGGPERPLEVALEMTVERWFEFTGYTLPEDDLKRVFAYLQEVKLLSKQNHALQNERYVRESMPECFWGPLVQFGCELDDFTMLTVHAGCREFTLVNPGVVAHFPKACEEIHEATLKLRKAVETLNGSLRWAVSEDDSSEFPHFSRELLNIVREKKLGTKGAGKSAENDEWKDKVYRLVESMSSLVEDEYVL